MFNRADRRAADRAVLRAVLLLLAGLLAALPLAPRVPAQELVNRVVIRVNDRIATLHDYQQRVEEIQADLARREELTLAQRRQRLADLPEQVFNTLLQEQLLLSRADQLGIVFTEEEVDDQMARIRESYGVATEEEFLAILAQQNMNLREFREQVRTGMRIQELLAREVRSQLGVDEEVARVYYRDNPEQFMAPKRLYLRELVVLEESNLPPEERLELARSLRAELMAGRAIEDLAEEYRELGVTSGAIDLGWVVGGDLARELQDAVWDLEPLAVSEPVEGRGGLHVIQVVERQEEGLRPFNEVAEQALGRARNELMAEAMEEYMEKLESSSYVLLDPPPEAADFRRVLGEPADELPVGEPSGVTVADEGEATEAVEEAVEEPVEDAGEMAAEAAADDPPPPEETAPPPPAADGGR